MSVQFRALDAAFAEELTALLLADNEPELADQLLSAEIVSRCQCEDDFCASFYTAPPPEGDYGPGHENIQLEPATGMVILDVVDGRVMQVEVLGRPDFRQKLRLALP